ncbi:hypothetical protein HG535_0B05890 [Zygotorulaspora mrakii]|uniref:Beige protein homolog 1 n=1 Tax=Zygotorulaspora mrakii TaxID=42260 RepID=A0A7H9AYQ9_ZYGMR|nr:uncharacterized protein HG535_0B05890 [Zygotorulaspora mrakii]QLG71545.1 hypothetical protein HG535_0B05890 [Zygotorulaspora mrakii]
MEGDIEILADLLLACLSLSPLEEQEGNLVATYKSSIRDHLVEILSNFSGESLQTVHESSSYQFCDMWTYIDSELAQRFELSTTDLHFTMNDLDSWSKLLLCSSGSIEYALCLQIIISLSNMSLMNKMALKKLGKLKSNYLDKLLSFIDGDSILVVEKSTELFSLILTVCCEPTDIFQLYNNFQARAASHTLNSLAAQLSDPLSQNYLQFENCYKTFKIEPNEYSQYTLQLFIEFNNVTSNRVMTIGRDIYLEIKEGQFCISNDEFIVALFTEYEFQEGILYSIAVVLDSDNISLYVGGSCVGKICLFEGSMMGIEQFDLGSMICSFKLFRFFIFNDIYTEDSIKILHAFGSFVKASFAKNTDLHDVRPILADMMNCSSRSLEEQVEEVRKQNEKNLITDLNPLEESSSGDHQKEHAVEGLVDHITMGKCYIYRGANLLPMFASVNCFLFILCSLENSKSMDDLFNYLSHLMTLLRNSHLRNWFQKAYGFSLLSHILLTKAVKKMGRSLPIQFLNLFQEYCGWDFSNITKSLINDEIAYQTLVLNIDLWYFHKDKSFENDAGLEIIRFLFFQIASLLENSKYQHYNSQKLRRLNILGRLNNTQHLFAERYGTPNIIKDLESELSHVYYGLLKDDFSKKNIQWLLQFSYFELKNGFSSNSEISLIALDRFCIEMLNKNDMRAIRVFSESVSPKFLVMLLNEITVSKGNPMIALNILFKLLLINKLAYKNFAKSGGLELIFHILRGAARFYEDIIYLLYLYSFGDYNLDPDLKVSEEFQNEAVPENNIIVMREAFLLAVELLEWAVINDIKESFPLDLESFICIFLKKVSILLRNAKNFSPLSPCSSALFRLLQDLLITLTKPQNSQVYSDSSRILIDILSERTIHSIKVLNHWEFERFFNELVGSYTGAGNGTPSLEKKVSYFELSFVHSILPSIVRQISGLKKLYEDLAKNTYMMANVLLLLDRCIPILIREVFDVKLKFELFLCLLNLTKLVKQGHSFKCLNKTGLDEIFSSITLSLLYTFIMNEPYESIPILPSFYGAILEDFDLLCDVKHSSHQSSMANSVVQFLLLRIEENLESDAIFCCLKSFSRQYEADHKILNEIFYTFDDPDDQSVFFSKITTNNKEALIEYLSGQDLFFQAKKEQLLKDITRKMRIKEDFSWGTAGGLRLQIIERKQYRMENSYSDAERKYALFRNDNIEIDKRLGALCVKYYANFITDMEEDIIAHNNQYSAMKCQYNYILDSQLNKHIELLWGVDSVQDHDMRKIRLVPFQFPHVDIDIGPPGHSPDHKIDEMKDKKQERKPSTSLLSYDLISDLESVDLDSNERKDQNRKILKVLKEGDSIRNIWNTSLVVGLDTREGILIFGVHNLYFVGDYYFVKEENKVLDLVEIPESERDTNVSLIAGYSHDLNSRKSRHEVLSWSLLDLVFVAKRPFLLRDAALELLMENGTDCFFSFKSKVHRDEVYYTLDKLKKNENIDPVLNNILQDFNVRSSSVGSVNGMSKSSFRTKLAKAFSNGSSLLDGLNATSQWQRGEISNFYYLMVLNTLAGRTFNDITQYPVFPWVIADYSSTKLNLNDPNTFRDLSKPMGAQSKKRKIQFMERYEALESLADPMFPPFHYGTHYSSAMIVSSYLIRLKPYVDSFLLLQGGKFGHADRLFSSIHRAWSSAAIENTTDVRELTPEFFFLPEFLININNYDFGKDQNGNAVVDVNLPPWANNDPKIFIWKNREALESPYVSSHLHLWIDLIFGFKQRGENAITAMNVFNSLSYPGAVNLDTISDDNERRAVTGIIHNFGQTPLQIFEEAHPPRQFLGTKMIHPGLWSDISRVPSETQIGDKDSPARYIRRFETADGVVQWKCCPFLDVTIGSGSGPILLRRDQNCGLEIGGYLYNYMHFAPISAFSTWKECGFVTGDSYGLIKVWEYSSDAEQSSVVHLGTLYGHLCEIKDLKANEECNVLLSVDASGLVYLWDMISYQIIRKIPIKGEHVALSANNGTIAVATADNHLSIYNSSAMLYADVDFSRESTISCLNFMNFSPFDLGLKRHIYWNEKEVIVVGSVDGMLRVYELVINDKSQWALHLLKKFETATRNEITCIATKLKICAVDSYDQNSIEVPQVEIVAGSSNGSLYLWR